MFHELHFTGSAGEGVERRGGERFGDVLKGSRRVRSEEAVLMGERRFRILRWGGIDWAGILVDCFENAFHFGRKRLESQLVMRSR